ncbi:MAG: ParB/RepB/Spo0J family partition protein, partial [Clostridiales bacterium]
VTELKDWRGKTQIASVKSKDLILPPNNPYTSYNLDTYNELLESVKTSGVHEPIIVRDMGDGSPYQILSGNHRNTANIEAGNENIEAIILKDISDAYAADVLSKANIIRSQRGDFIPSELAKIYKMSLDAEKEVRQERISKGEKMGDKVGDKIAEEHGVSKTNFYRYIRLLDLVPEFMDMVDSEDITIKTADFISCLPENQQMELYTSLLELDMELNEKTAEKLNTVHKEGNLTTLNIKDYLTGNATQPKPVKEKKESIKIDSSLYRQLMPNRKKKEIEAAVANDFILIHKTIPEALAKEGLKINENTPELIGDMLEAYIILQKNLNKDMTENENEEEYPDEYDYEEDSEI